MQELVATAQRVLAGEEPEDFRKLTRRRRHAVVSWDMADGWAVVELVRRGPSGVPEDESINSELVGPEWMPRGGGGGGGDDDPLADRPSEAELGAPFRWRGSHSHNASAGRILPLGGRQIRSERFDVAAEVTAIEVHGRGTPKRTVPVRRHGHAVVLWSSRWPPTIRFLGPGGQTLAERRPPRYWRM